MESDRIDWFCRGLNRPSVGRTSRRSLANPRIVSAAPCGEPTVIPYRRDLMPTRESIIRLDELPGVACPCGTARRGFADRTDFPATVHLTEITHQARTHYHRLQTEVYVVLECEPDAAIELDGVSHPVDRLSAILIPPGVRHRGVGQMRVLIYCTPKFDPADEYFD